jgi:hypothetical protein
MGVVHQNMHGNGNSRCLGYDRRDGSASVAILTQSENNASGLDRRQLRFAPGMDATSPSANSSSQAGTALG